jgi:hypothetical protein
MSPRIGTKDSATAVNVGVVGSWLICHALARSELNVGGDPPVVYMTLASADADRAIAIMEVALRALERIDDFHQCKLGAAVLALDGIPINS